MRPHTDAGDAITVDAAIVIAPPAGIMNIFQAFFEASNEAMLIVDAGRRVVIEANPQAAAVTGYALDELKALPLVRLLGRADVERLADAADAPHVRLMTRAGKEASARARVTKVTHAGRGYLFVTLEHSARSVPALDSPSSAPPALSDSGIVGHSERIKAVCRLVESVADSDTTVLIQGASGTGKEVVANVIHARSRRRGAPFVKVNCAALTESLLESELFGHVKGAFTGAVGDRSGRFKRADRGTILLDEIGSMPLPGQAALLRVLQEREFEPVGSSITTTVDVRVIAASNTDLARAVDEGQFRADLYYRLNVFGIELPPLRERAEDIPLLSTHFLRRYAEVMRKSIRGFAPEALSALVEHDWPGNVRQLENAVEHAVIVETRPEVQSGSLPAVLSARAGAAGSGELGLRERLTVAERQILLDTLARANGIKKRAAEMLGIDSRNMPYFLRKHGLQDAVRS